MPEINLYNRDCMEAMAEMDDNQFELAIVDPEYGINASAGTGGYSREWLGNVDKKWDKEPASQDYIKEIFRVSGNQIIWGGNYFNLPHSRGWVCWYKTNEVKGRDFSEFELAFTSFDRPARHFEYRPFIRGGRRIHPTQKPVALYKWLLKNYAIQGDKILDTHGGSASIAIACYDMGFDLDLYELDEDYYEAAKNRFEQHTKQGVLI